MTLIEEIERSEEGATKGPFRYSAPHESFGIVWAGKVPVAEMTPNGLPCDEQRANAKLPVLLVNNLPALKAALKHSGAMLARVLHSRKCAEFRCQDCGRLAREERDATEKALAEALRSAIGREGV